MKQIKDYLGASIALLCTVIALVVGVLALTVWRPAQAVVASVEPDQPIVMTRDGVLPLLAPQVTVTATAPDASDEVTIAYGTTGDVLGWIGSESYTEVVGVESGMTTLKTVAHPSVAGDDQPQSAQSGAKTEGGAQPAQPAPDAGAQSGAQSGAGRTSASSDAQAKDSAQESATDLASSDMWLDEVTGTGSVALELTDLPEGRSIIAAVADSDEAPTLTLTWAVHRTNTVAIVAFTAMGIFLLAAVLLFFERRRVLLHRAQRAQRHRERESADVTDTHTIPAVESAALSLGEDAAPGEAHESAEESAAETSAEEAEEAPADEDSADNTVAVTEDAEAGTSSAEDAPQAHDATGTSDIEGDTRDDREGDAPATADEAPQRTATSDHTDTGTIEVVSSHGTQVFPSRRAIREARERGDSTLSVGGREWNTGLIPVINPDEHEGGNGDADSRGPAGAHGTPERTGRRSWASITSRWSGGPKDRTKGQR